MNHTSPAFAFPAEAGTHLPTPEGWSELAEFFFTQVLEILETVHLWLPFQRPVIVYVHFQSQCVRWGCRSHSKKRYT